MKKYDCTRTLDYHHEKERMCDSYPAGCENSCPFADMDCDDITEEHIRIVQEWSDEHPEMPTITKEERAFLKAFKITEGKYIKRTNGMLRISFNQDSSFEIWGSMFPFIEDGEWWGVGELLELEVQDE